MHWYFSFQPFTAAEPGYLQHGPVIVISRVTTLFFGFIKPFVGVITPYITRKGPSCIGHLVWLGCFFVIESFSGNGIRTLKILFKEWHWILRDEQMSMRNDRGRKWLGLSDPPPENKAEHYTLVD